MNKIIPKRAIVFVMIIFSFCFLFGCTNGSADEDNGNTSNTDGKLAGEIVENTQGSFIGDKSEGEEFSFIFLGDCQQNPDEPDDYASFKTMIETAYESEKPDFILLGGDMINDGEDQEEWETFFKAGEEVFSKIPVRATRGNHEFNGYYKEYFGDYYTSYDYGTVEDGNNDIENGNEKAMLHITVLDSNLMGLATEEDIAWVENDLKESDSKWKVVMFHHPAYPALNPGKDQPRIDTIQENFVPLFEEYGVDLVLNGHQHIYMRAEVNEVVYIIGNTSGKSYSSTSITEYEYDYIDKLVVGENVYTNIDVSEDKLVIITKNLEGEVVDEYVIE